MARRFMSSVAFALIAFSAMGALRIEDAYIAPENHYIFRLVFPDGSSREFQRDPSGNDGLISLDGWDGQFGEDGTITVRRHEGDAVPEAFKFFQGRLVEHVLNGERHSFPYESNRSAPASPYPPLAMVTVESDVGDAISYSQKELENKWSDTGRLAFPYGNPNLSGALCAEIALLLAALAVLFGKGRRCVAAAALAVVFAAFTAWSGSRGALLGLAAGSLFVALTRIRVLLKSRAFWILSAIAVACIVVWLALGGWANVTRGFTSSGRLDWSNAIRLDLWGAAPKMMVDAPCGWGDMRVGRVYMDWYQPLDALCLTGSLMNDHLTLLTQVGWACRCIYVLLLSFVLTAGAAAAFAGKNPMTLSVWSAFVIMSWFNPLYSEWGLWIVPALSLLPMVCFVLRRWKVLAASLSLSLVLSGCAMAVIFYLGSRKPDRPDRPPVFTDGTRVCVNGSDPAIWVVDDGAGALGGLLVGQDVRAFYAEVPELPAMGYVRDISDLPKKGVERLVLAGKAGNDWLLRLSEDESARENLPKSVVFVSPPFSPSEVPEGVLALCHPRIVVGEFAARFDAEYGEKADWITIVPGMEKYLLLWPQYVLGE